MKNNKKAKLLLMIMFLMLTLTACRGKEIDQKNVSFEYNKRVESVVIKNEHDFSDIYVTFNIVLLNKEKEVLYKEPYDETLIEDEYTVNLEDVKPEWIEYDKIDSMDVEIVKVYDYDFLKEILVVIAICILVFFVIILLLIVAPLL